MNNSTNKICALWINVEGHRTRHDLMLDELTKNNIPNKRIDAITPKNLPPLIKKDYDCTPDIEIACMCSHLKAYQTALNTDKYADIDWFLILEDDMIFLEGLDKLYQLIEEAPDDAQCLQLYCCNPDAYLEFLENNAKGKQWLPYKNFRWAANAYLISREGMNINLWAYFENGKTVDLRQTGYLTNPESIAYIHLNTYTLTVPTFLTRVNIESTIHNDHVSDFAYSNFMVTEIRRMKETPNLYIFILTNDEKQVHNLVTELNKEHYIQIVSCHKEQIEYDDTKENLDELRKYPRIGQVTKKILNIDLLIEKLPNTKIICFTDKQELPDPNNIICFTDKSIFQQKYPNNFCIIENYNAKEIYEFLQIPKRIFRN